MKKIYLLIVLMLMPILVIAKEYEVKDLDLKLSISDDWFVFTRENIKNNATLKEFNITEEYMEKAFNDNKAYIDALPKDFSIELFVTVPVDNLEMHNLSNFPDKLIDQKAKEVIKDLVDANYKLYDNGKYKFMEISFFDKATSMYIYRFYTVVNSKGIGFHLQKAEKISDDEIKILKEIVDSVNFEIKDELKMESKALQKEIDNFLHPTNKIMLRIVIYAIVGGVIGALTAIISKKKKMR